MAKLSQFAQKSLRDSFKDASGMLTGFGQGIPPVQPAQQFNTGDGGGGLGKSVRNVAEILTGRDFSTDEEIEKEKLQEIIDHNKTIVKIFLLHSEEDFKILLTSFLGFSGFCLYILYLSPHKKWRLKPSFII